MILVTAAVLTTAAPGSIRTASATAPLLMLSQIRLGDGRYAFVDAAIGQVEIKGQAPGSVNIYGGYDKPITIFPSNIIILCNEPSYARVGDLGDQFGQAGIAVADPGIETWMDRRGLVHSISVLRQQQDYNMTLLRYWRADCAAASCKTKLPDGSELAFKPLKITGILDSATLRSPAMLLRLQLTQLRAELSARCHWESHEDCGPADEMPTLSLRHLQSLIVRAEIATALYEHAVDSINLVRPSVSADPPYDKALPGERYSGLSAFNDLAPTITARIGDSFDINRFFAANDILVIRDDGYAPESAVNESVSPASLASKLIALNSLQLKATDAIAEAHHFVAERYPETGP